jgi:hypothetical protein
MFFWQAHGDGEEFLLILLVGTLIGGLCGAVPLTVGLLRRNKSMAWLGFGVCVLTGVAFLAAALLPAIVFTIIAAVTEPIEKGKKRRGRRRRRRERADDLLDDDFGPKRKRTDDDDFRRRRRRRYEDEYEDEYDDRPRRRAGRRRYDD